MLVLAILFACTDEPTSPEPLSTRTAAETAETIGPRPDTVFNSFLVAFSDEVGDPAALSAELTEEVGGYRYYVYRYVVKGFAVANLSAEALSALEAHPLVRYVEAVRTLRAHEKQDVSGDPDLWALDRVDEYARQFDGAHYYFFPGTDSHIYILDTGIAGGHQEFTGRLGNGVTKLSWSWDADPYHDQHGHGTAVASMAGGTTVGVAKQATLHSVRIDEDGDARTDDMIAGLDWVAEYHVKHPPRSTTGPQHRHGLGNGRATEQHRQRIAEPAHELPLPARDDRRTLLGRKLEREHHGDVEGEHVGR